MSSPLTAFITGISGQDGSYLAEYLLGKGYTVHGLLRPRSQACDHRDSWIRNFQHSESYGKKLVLHFGDMTEPFVFIRILKMVKIDEIYHMAAQSHVGLSFDLQLYTCDVNALGTLRLLEAITSLGLQSQIKFYNACSSEVFGLTKQLHQNEKTAFEPASPYAAAKAFSYWLTVNIRRTHGMFAVNGILFNHESPRRGHQFVTRKITTGVARIHLGLLDCISLGNLDARRDWGHAKDYIHGAYLMLQQSSPDDFVLATGITRSVREFVNCAFSAIGYTLTWSGKGLDEVGRDEHGRIRLRVEAELMRPLDVPHLQGDSSKAVQQLGWQPRTTFHEMVKEMVDADILFEQSRPGQSGQALDMITTHARPKL